tara:strand:- start:1752 stop:2009 length:258 start_codon:yes stop_codon:yes gene_type:complete
MDKDKEKVKAVMDRVKKGNYKLRPGFPKDVQVATEAFFKATQMMIDEELEYVPSEYLFNLLKTLAKYPEYNKITLDLLKSAQKEM